jgi:DNA adenine methylase
MATSKRRARIVRSSPIAPRLARAQRADAPAMPPSAAWPIIKWVGGKTKLLPELATRLPQGYRRYYEPFAGGAALFFHLGPTAAVLSDRNADLIGMYRAVAADPDGVLRRLALHRDAHGTEHYYQTRARWNDRAVSWSVLDRAATFIYLNRTCFNGLWRVNKGGGFNVPMGRYKNPAIYDAETIGRASAVLRGATLLCGDYRDAVADAGPGDLVYFDPPYDPVTTTANFTAYTGDGFSRDDQRRSPTPCASWPSAAARWCCPTPTRRASASHVQGPAYRSREVPARDQLRSDRAAATSTRCWS